MTAYPTSDAYRITWLIRRLFRAMGVRAGEYLADLGISAAERAVMEFLYPDEKLSVPQIAERYKVSRQHVQVTANSLLDKKLVSTRDNPRHRRSPLLMLTDTGRGLFGKVMKKDEQAIHLLFSGVSEINRKQTRKTLERLLANLSGGHRK